MKYKIIEGEKLPIIEYVDTISFMEGFGSWEDYMYRKLVNRIDEVLKGEKEDDYILLAVLGEEEHIFGSPRCVWVDNLKGALEYFIGIEDYEICSKVQKMIDKLLTTS